jgi:AI-2 transport protein TqsA
MSRAPKTDSPGKPVIAKAGAAKAATGHAQAAHDHNGHHHFEAIKARQLARIATGVAVLATIGGAVALSLLQGLLTPLIVAVFLMILVDAVSRQVAKYAPASPEWLRVLASFLLMIAILCGAVAVVVHSAPRFAAEMSGASGKIKTILNTVVGKSGLSLGPADTLLKGIDIKPYVTSAMGAVEHLVTDFIFVVVYLGFLLASRAAFRDKLALLFPDPESRGHAQRVFDRVRSGAEDYIGLQTFKAVALALAAWAVMAALGLHSAMFLAFLILLVAYIPILGPAAAVVVPVILAIIQFDLTWRPLVMFLALETVVIGLDNILLPRMQAEKLDVDPVVVLLSLGFWSMIFGVIGALLSTPLTVLVIAIASEAPALRWLAIMLSKGGRPAAKAAIESELA